MTKKSRQAKLATLQGILDTDLSQAEWTKSSFSGGGSGDCLEVTAIPGKGYMLRHSILKDKMIPLTEAEYIAHCKGVKANENGLVPPTL